MLEVDMTASSVRYTEKKLPSPYIPGMPIVFNPKCLRMWIKSLGNKLCSIPNMLEVDMRANSVSYTGKIFHPHTYRGCLSFSIQNAQECG